MAVTPFGSGYVLSANGDRLDQATIGHPGSTGSMRVRVNQMNLVCTGATGGACVVKAGSPTSSPASGKPASTVPQTPIWTGSISANSTQVITAFGEPQELDDIEATTLGTNVILVVFIR